MSAAIINRGRGPEIAGSRITVYDVLAETGAGATPEQLAQEWNLQVEQIHAAQQYIEEHKDEVLEGYRKIKERHARGNPPEVQAILDAIHTKYEVLWADRKRRAREAQLAEDNHEGHPGGH